MNAIKKFANTIPWLDRFGTNSKIILTTTLILVFTAYNAKLWIERKMYFRRNKLRSPTSLSIIEFSKAMYYGLIKYDEKLIQKYGKISGVSVFSRPAIFTTDIDFIKSILIKDFNSFVNRNLFDGIVIEPFDKMVLFLKDDEWKSVRTLLTPTFTSGKLKKMSKIMKRCAENFNDFLQELVEKGDGILDTNKYFGSYTLDVISGSCFGIDTNSIKEPDNEIIYHLKAINSHRAGFLNWLITILFPKLGGYLARKEIMSVFPLKSTKYIVQITNQIIERRKKAIEKRDDFIQYMVDHEAAEMTNKNSDSRESENLFGEDDSHSQKWKTLRTTLSNSEIVSQAIVFLSAGYETTQLTLGYIAYNLALYPEHQITLCEEIDQILEKYNGEINYDSLYEMKFMDMIIDESLRLYPITPRIDRVACKDYTYKHIKMNKGDIVLIPLWALQRDPDLYPNPETFDPYRFSEENKKNRESCAFLPFGNGPRNCIGMRFALVEIKFLLAYIMSKYKFVKSSDTQVPLELEKIRMKPVNSIKVKVEKRN